jgi:predicted DNA-binding transcriptional regulator YafY
MLDTSARLLRLLGLLQRHRDWTAPALADRLGVTTRTVRRDVDRLRELGYPVHAAMGPGGGYRLGPGAALPPLLLDDEEAVAITVGLRTAAVGGVAGMDEAALRALAKLDQVLPSRLRHRISSLQQATVAVPARSSAAVEPEVLTAIAAAIRAGEVLRVDYRTHQGAESYRMLEPHRVVVWGQRWYLVGWDHGAS